MQRRIVAPLVVALLAALPRAAHACPVCFDPRDENRFAFLATTIFLTLLPLGMVAGLVVFLRRRYRQLDQAASTDAAAADPVVQL